MDPSAGIHYGSWTNWEDGRIQGGRITLPENQGDYLITFLALFVQLASQHTWGIFCFLTFTFEKTSHNSDKLESGRRAIVRNAGSDSSTAWQLLSLGWDHRKISRRITLYAIAALAHLLAFTAAGILVSQVAMSSTQVLVKGQVGKCGQWDVASASTPHCTNTEFEIAENTAWDNNLGTVIQTASTFTKQCYNTTTTPLDEATQHTQRSAADTVNCNAIGPGLVKWNVSTDIACPFASQMCPSGAVRFDSGLLDSQHHFGINSRKKDRVKYRRVTECAVLTQGGYISQPLRYSQGNLSNEEPFYGGSLTLLQNSTFVEYYYGETLDHTTNATYIWSNASTPNDGYGNADSTSSCPYTMKTKLHTVENPLESDFTPIDALKRADADVVLLFLHSDASYTGPVYDPWFLATESFGGNCVPQDLTGKGASIGLTNWAQTLYASVMACTEQYQYCNHDSSRCSPLTGSAPGGSVRQAMTNLQAGLDLNPRQKATQERLFQASFTSDINTVVERLPIGLNVLAPLSGNYFNLPPLPDNQWILEMQHYFVTGLASVQLSIAAYASGPLKASNDQYLQKPTNKSEGWACDNQIVQRVGHKTFSTLGVALVLAIGGLFIIANTIIQMKCSDNSLQKPKKEWDEFSSLHLLYHGPPESTKSSLPMHETCKKQSKSGMTVKNLTQALKNKFRFVNNPKSDSEAQHTANAKGPTTSSAHTTTSSTAGVSLTPTPTSSASPPLSIIRASSSGSALVPDDQNSTGVLPLPPGISCDTKLSSDAENNGASMEDEGHEQVFAADGSGSIQIDANSVEP